MDSPEEAEESASFFGDFSGIALLSTELRTYFHWTPYLRMGSLTRCTPIGVATCHDTNALQQYTNLFASVFLP